MEAAPGPRRSSVASLRELRRDPIGFLTRASAYGDVSHVRLPRTSLYVLNHPDLVQLALVHRHRDVRKGPSMDAAKRLLGESLLTSNGDPHLERRRLLQPIFHHERIAGHGPTMVALAERTSERWSDGETIDVHAEMARLALAIVARTLFGVDVEDARAREIAGALTEVLAQFDRAFSPWLRVTGRLPLPANRRFERAREVFDRTVYAMIRERRAAGDGADDVLSLLLEAEEDGVGLSDEQVRDEAITLFLAGHETTANALAWTWLLLAQHPDRAATLHAELDEVLAGRAPHADDVGSLRFTGAALHESMRLYPPAWAIGRRVLTDIDARGYRIPAGSVIVVSPWLLHHDPRWWDSPDVFAPERWLTEDRPRPRHAYLPFGAGPRMCIGEGFAWLEATLVLATIARRWSLSHDPAHRVELQPVITLRPRTGIPMTPWRRIGVARGTPARRR
jgi:cytochrome P450